MAVARVHSTRAASRVGMAAAGTCGVSAMTSGRRSGASRMQRCRAKKDIHPEFHKEAKVYCNGEEVFAVGGTDESYDVDIWSGNHPAFMEEGGASTVLDDELIVKFTEKFGDMGDFGCGPYASMPARVSAVPALFSFLVRWLE